MISLHLSTNFLITPRMFCFNTLLLSFFPFCCRQYRSPCYTTESKGIHCIILAIFKQEGQKILNGHHLVYKATGLPTGAKQSAPIFQRGHTSITRLLKNLFTWEFTVLVNTDWSYTHSEHVSSVPLTMILHSS